VGQIKAQNNLMKSQNDLRIVESFSPTSKEAVSRQMAAIRVRQMQMELDRLESSTRPATVNTSEQDVASDLTFELE